MFIILRFFFFWSFIAGEKKKYYQEINFLLFSLFYFTCALSLHSLFLSIDLEHVITPAGVVTVVELHLNGVL